ncbi:GH32 C-terminal domain-containing protein [Agromyces aureus]|uniref:Glycosyl hydrolase family 32 n=1 Tax=Agromyces aureus TaxID=453304 RepID=A0A191WD32_9MICO|nr:GH32 C-terminal domain-containing protein [Agromyces aureus]ANJ26113.1 glycosyl hydrolase family 32 [Agromyces aureus]
MTTRSRRRTTAAGIAVAALTTALVGVQLPAASADEPDPGGERYRPAVHFTPERNWMNDPNGLVYDDGTWHLFFQHNPAGTRWGNMSWGHATSDDLVHWQEQPLAIAQGFDDSGTAIEDIFSGSVVVDEQNTSGLGTAENPPLVAIYTSAYTPAHPTHAGIQAQSLAYSTDDGQTWTKYAGNPVLDRDSANFRDPKVFRYENPATGEQYWVMVAVEALDHRVVLSRSDNLIDWTHLSDFGPANAVGGIWECPDLFELPVDGDPATTKWVMIVNLNPGAVAGGSGGQYFVGDFDGTTFTSESTVTADNLPAGEVFAGFDGGDYDGWTVANEPGNRLNGPWTDAPASGSLAGQNPVTGFVGAGLVNGFADGDWPVGTLESPTFTIEQPFVNLLVGGGNHPHVPGTQLGNEPPPGDLLFDGFEFADGTTLADTGWQATGDFATEPARNPATAGGDFFIGSKRINTWEGGPRGDDNVGDLTSPAFRIGADDTKLSFLLGGGRRDHGSLEVQLLVDGQVVRTQTGADAGQLAWHSWDVAEFAGRDARIRVHDAAAGGWGHLTFDHVVLGAEAAVPRSDETSVSLVVDGEVVRTATGANSETLDWTSWNVEEFAGHEASVRIVDNNRFGWGHILVDQVMFADEAAAPRIEGYDWLDWGRDYYAAVSFANAPDGRRVKLGWMNNWDYANEIPTGSWRSSMALPREVALATTDRGPRLVQQVVSEVADLEQSREAETVGPRAIEEGSTALDVAGDVLKIDAVFEAGDADEFGLSVLGDGAGSATRIGYDVAAGRLFVDRRASGDTSFHPSFSSIDDAPVVLDDGRLAVTVYVDRASVEVFTADGRTTITDQVFPTEGADRLGIWAEGGDARLVSLTATPLATAMFAPKGPEEPEVPTDDGATAPPARGVLSSNNGWDTGLHDGDFDVTMNLWWGENASLFRLYRDGELVHTERVTPSTPAAQRVVVPVAGLGNGTYEFTGELVNSKGATPTGPLTVKVRDANPGKPLLSHDNWDRDGDYRVTADLWWGQNATSYRFLENGVVVAEGKLTAKTPGAQRATLDVAGRPKGSYSYTVEFRNAAGTTTSAPVTVQVAR